MHHRTKLEIKHHEQSCNVFDCLATIATLFLLLSSAAAWAQTSKTQTMSLAGNWRFEMDRADAGLNARWFDRDLADHIQLPGTLQGQGFGDEISVDTPWVAALPRDMKWYLLPQYQPYTKPGNIKMPYLSQPVRHYLGVAWYQRDIEIDGRWQGDPVVLSMERPHWETSVWVDDRQVGSCRSLVAPHIYDLGILPVGTHRLSVRIDNRMILPYRPDAHSVSDAEGQTWNGIAGAIELSATTPVWIQDAQVFPNTEKKSVRIHVTIGNLTGKDGAGTIASGNSNQPVRWTRQGGEADIEISLGPDAQVWSEFSPTLYPLTLHLSGDDADDARDLVCGLREIKRDGQHILLNGTQINIRGTHDGGGFPLTGYPATDVESWKRIIGTCKTWGFNAIRFHSWCPPEAAFTAADEIGFYLQPECGMWNSFDKEGHMLEVLNDETARMSKAYGNHPSFMMLSATNEPAGNFKTQLPTWEKKWREQDPRRLYTDGTGRPAISANQPSQADFVVTAGAGLHDRARGPTGWFGLDYQSAMADANLPVIGHEVGQWCAYPDFNIIAKFTGYLRPGNLEIARDSAAAHGLLENNQRIAYASGRFQLACYKEEIEANLRTPGFSGFELLDLHDYLGQGGAFVGLLDAFWEPKGYVNAEEFRRFCNTTVPLARLKQRIYTTADTLAADVELAHFGPAPLPNAPSYWRIEDATGKTLMDGQFPPRNIPIGKNIALGKIAADLASVPAPAACRLVVGLTGTDFENDWKFWVYPKSADQAVPADVLLTSVWSAAEDRLRAGGKVLFQPRPRDLGPDDPAIPTTPIFWNRVMNGSSAWFLGLWCDSSNPALNGFPTTSNCDWQWIDVTRGAHAMNLARLPRALQPIVQPIDDSSRNFKLGLIYECNTTTGRLLVCSADLSAPKPTAIALRNSLLSYMAGDHFHPITEIPITDLRNQWTSTQTGKTAKPAASQTAQPRAPEVDAPPEIGDPAHPRQ